MSVFPSDVGGRRSRQDGNQPRVGKRPHGSVCKCVPGGRQHTCSGGDPDDLRERKQFIIFRATTLGMSIRAGGTHPGISNYDSPPPPTPRESERRCAKRTRQTRARARDCLRLQEASFGYTLNRRITREGVVLERNWT